MRAGFDKRLLIVWLVLCGATLVSLVIGSADGEAAPVANAAMTCSAIGIALVKVRIIFREFMDVRHAPALLGRLTDAWVLLTGICLLGAYFVGNAYFQS